MTHRRNDPGKPRRKHAARRRAQARQDLKRVLLAFVLIAVAAAVVFVATSPLSSSPEGGYPDPVLTTSDGSTFRISDFRGKPVILFFMTTSDWCAPCRAETRDVLVPLQNTYGSRIQIVSLEQVVDRTHADMEGYRREFGSWWPYARDPGGELARAYGAPALSTVVVLDQEGRVVLKRADPPLADLTASLSQLGASP